jgi:hypothetical protein
MYRSQGFSVRSIVFDGESGIAAIADDLRADGITVNQLGKSNHVVIVELKNRVIKERYRCVKNSITNDHGTSFGVLLRDAYQYDAIKPCI